MRAIFKRELRAYFATPIVYVFGALFLLLSNLMFFLGNVLNRMTDLNSLFFIMQVLLMLTVPILTMRLLSEEFKQRTDQLLLTAPIRPIDITLGKFFAAFAIVIAVLACTLVFPLVTAIFGSPNWAAVWGNYVALLCAAASFIAIGLFISALTESQILSLLGTMGLFILLGLLYLLIYIFVPQSTAWLHNFVEWFSPFTRYGSFTGGIFPLNDLLFYITLTALFLFLSSRILEKKRWA